MHLPPSIDLSQLRSRDRGDDLAVGRGKINDGEITMLVTHRRLTRRGGARQVQDVTETSAVAERVLVVDDEPDIVALVAYHLAKSGYTVSTATSGPEGLAVARRDKPSLIVLDLMLPGLSGLEVMEELRGDNATSNIAVPDASETSVANSPVIQKRT